jgi:hypothetical protein
LIDKGAIGGEKINLQALLINKYASQSFSIDGWLFINDFIFSGWIDPLIQNKAYIDFASNAPGYGALAPPAVLQAMSTSYHGPGGCSEQQQACYAGGNSTNVTVSEVCAAADQFCVRPPLSFLLGSR